MAKSEETAALMEKARSEKTSGTAATRQRKKERKDSLLRDGLKHGQGASIFFYKTMYNRFRFSHFGFLTKTMETYFVAAVGIAAAMRFYFGSDNILPVTLSLGGLVFFRAMGNPLAEDTGMDFFRLIPESTWQKLFYSLLGGTVSCLLDLLLPMLAASAVLMVNPLKILIWLPLIVSVDFYATSVVTFIDLSVPASIGKTIKTLVTVMFIYFGLMPDIAILAFGIVQGHTLSAAVGSTTLNLALGVLAFSLASVFLQPKGRDYVETQAEQDFPAAKRRFSAIGLSIVMLVVLTNIIQLAVIYGIQAWCPQVMESNWGFWLVVFCPQYLVAVPACLVLLRKLPATVPEQHSLELSCGVKFFFITLFSIAFGLILSAISTSLAALLIGKAAVNPLGTFAAADNLAAKLLFLAILAPIIEEYVFRKQLIDRMRIYGGKTAIIVSALLFGLIHGNLFQFFYAFMLGLCFGYIYLNTGRLRYSIAAHILVNTVCTVLIGEVLARSPGENGGWAILYLAYLAVIFLGGLVGLVVLCMNWRSLRFPVGALELPQGRRFRTICLNPGMAMAILCNLALMVLSLFL